MKLSEFLSDNLQFLVVKFSIYLNRCVFVVEDSDQITNQVDHAFCHYLIWYPMPFYAKEYFREDISVKTASPAFWRMVYSCRKEYVPFESKFFPFRVALFQEGFGADWQIGSHKICLLVRMVGCTKCMLAPWTDQTWVLMILKTQMLNLKPFFFSKSMSPMLHIMKTRLFKYIENFTSKNWKFSDKKLIFFIFLLKT